MVGGLSRLKTQSLPWYKFAGMTGSPSRSRRISISVLWTQARQLLVPSLIPVWGMTGIWMDKFGFRNEWEFWVQIVVYRLYQASYSSYSQTLMAELPPPGFDYMSVGLFGLSSRASSIIGPNVI